MQDCLLHSVSTHPHTKYLLLLPTDMRRCALLPLARSATLSYLRSVLSPTMHSVAVWLSLSAGWCISRSAIQGDTLLGHTAILAQGMDTGCTGGRLRQKVGRQIMLLSFKFNFSDDEREGKSYGGPHLANLGIVPAAVGVVPGPGGYGVVHGNVDISFLYKVHTGVPCSFLNA